MWKVSEKRIKELRAEFINYDTLREFLNKEISKTTGDRLSFFLDLRTALDLAADAAEAGELGDPEKQLDALSGFLR